MHRRQFLWQAGVAALAPAADVDLASSQWKARWIMPPGGDPDGYGVYHFRRRFSLSNLPAACKVHVTADSRYELFCNGVKVSWGPARGDLRHWRYETVDLTPHLQQGENLVAAVVWNDGPHAALCQHSWRTAFLLQAGDTAHESLLNTGPGWLCLANPAYQAIPVPNYQATGYYAIGPCEQVDASRYPWGWQSLRFVDADWAPAQVYRNGSPRDGVDAPTPWMLVARPIPAMEETPQRLARLRSATGVQPPAAFPASPAPFDVPAFSKAVFLLDQGALTTAFPVLKVSGGPGAKVTLEYTEALYQEMKPRRRKGNRGETEGKTFTGYGDVFISDGQPREYRPLFWRTYRYIRLTVETAGQPLRIEDLHGVYTGYPFAAKARFDSGVELHRRINEVGWRTARLCAHETYMDCPYYEQLQYAGDTRIQAIISYYMTGDARLARNAIEQLDSSRTPEGATFSRAPSTLQQYIPPFSLWWIGMLRDYWWYVDDPAFVRQMLPGSRAVLSFYQRYQAQDGLLRQMPWWNYVDWVEQWPRGTPPCEPGLMPASIQLQWLLGLQYAIDLETALGSKALAQEYRATADALTRRIRAAFWSTGRGLYSEDLAHAEFSQHANVLAVLAGLETPASAKALLTKVWPDKTLYPCSVYFRYYLDRAMAEYGLGDLYLQRLGTWEYMLQEGLTTFAEQDNPYSRSDCHAWAASPCAEFLRTVLGVDSAAPGFAKVRIRPHLGALTRVSGSVPHPKGVIEVTIEKKNGRLDIRATAPAGIEILRG